MSSPQCVGSGSCSPAPLLTAKIGYAHRWRPSNALQAAPATFYVERDGKIRRMTTIEEARVAYMAANAGLLVQFALAWVLQGYQMRSR